MLLSSPRPLMSDFSSPFKTQHNKTTINCANCWNEEQKFPTVLGNINDVFDNHHGFICSPERFWEPDTSRLWKLWAIWCLFLLCWVFSHHNQNQIKEAGSRCFALTERNETEAHGLSCWCVKSLAVLTLHKFIQIIIQYLIKRFFMKPTCRCF